MQKSFRLVVLLTGFLLLSGCAEITKLDPTSDVYQKIDGTFIDQIEKKSWSSNIDNFPDGINIIRTNFQGIVRQKTMVSYLESICRRLLEHSPVSKVPFQITLTASQGYGEALATPDGIIAVPLGFLKNVESEDEIAWLLAHELAHIILRHHDIAWVEQYHEKTVTAAEQTLTAINLSNQIRSNFDVAADNELTSAAEKALTINSMLYKINTRGLMPAWQRDQEDEADLLGLDLVVKSGYDLSTSIVVLEKILQWSGEEEKKIQNLLNRKEYFEKMLNDLRDFQTLEEIRDYFSKFVQNEVDSVNNWASRTHRMTQKRIESLAEYMEREYEEVENTPTISSWNKLVNRKTIKKILSRYLNTWEAERLLSDHNLSEQGNDGTLDDIQKKIKEALKEENKYDSKPRIVFSTLREKEGKQDLSIKNLELALKEPNTSMAVYKQLVNLHQASGNPKKALLVLAKANREFNNPTILYPLRIKIEVLAGNQEQALNLTKECKHRARKLYEACRKALESAVPQTKNPQPSKSKQPRIPRKIWKFPEIPLPF